MSNILLKEKLELAPSLSQSYQNNSPFPNITIDNFINQKVIDEIIDVFPNPEELMFYKYDNPLEKKLAMDQLEKLPSIIQQTLLTLNSVPFLSFLEELTGIQGLIPDPYFRGGGIHQIPPGGKLDVHIDFNIHPKLKLNRRLNVLLYLNKDWKEDYGGHFELWEGKKENGAHILKKCHKKILPIANRLAIFSTSEKSYHGHPNPLTCPPDRTRKSIALYYYTSNQGEQEDVKAHSTTFIKRPEDPNNPELDQLRKERNKSRIKKDDIPN